MVRKTLKEKPYCHICRFVFYFLLVAVIVFFVYNNYNFSKDYERLYDASKIDSIESRMSSVLSDINSFPRSSVGDILYLSEISQVVNRFDSYVSVGDLMSFIQQNSAYYQLILVGINGEIVSGVEFFDGNYSLISKGNSFDFTNNIFLLDKGEVFISDISIETIGDVPLPILTYFTPVYENDIKKGYLVMKVYADYFLEDLRRASREGEEVFLIRSNGEYLANQDSEKEFALNEGVSFYSDYPYVHPENLINPQTRTFESENYLFSARHLVISGGYFSEISGDEANDWILIFVSDKSELNQNVSQFFWIGNFFLLIILILFFFIRRRFR